MGLIAVERPRLQDQLAESASPVISIVAGAGYGKTTLVRQWDHADDRDFVWIELQPGDDDPVVFMRLLIERLGALMDLGEAAEAAREPRPRFAERILPAIERATSAHGDPFVIVVDEVELIGPEVASLLNDVLARLPGCARTVLVGRSIPAELHTARLRIEGNLVELRAEHLAFDPDEATSMFAGSGEAVDAQRIARLVELTMGWPIGLRLAATAEHVGSSARSPGGHLALERHAGDVGTGDEELLERYFDEELLSDLDPEDRSFLFDSSVLEWLDGTLCDRVLGASGSTERLDRLVTRGRVLFVAGGARRSLRFHPVMRDRLLDGLRRRDPDREAALRRRAVAEYEALGQHRTAIDVAIGSGDARYGEEVLVRHLPTIIFSGENILLGRWIERLRYGAQRHPSGLLALAEAWLAFLTNRREDMEVCLRLADSLGHHGRLPDGSESMGIASAALRMLAGSGGIPASFDNARAVHDAGPEGSPWWGISSNIEALTGYMLGLTDDVREHLRVAEFESRGIHASHAVTCAHLGHAELLHGNINTGLSLTRAAVAELTEAALVDFPPVVLAFCADAYAETVRGDTARSRAASAHARSLMAQMIDVVDRASIHAHLVLGDAALARGDIDEARQDLRVARDCLVREPEAVVLSEWADRLADELFRATGQTLPELTSAELRVLAQLPTHRSLSEIGEHLYVSRNTVKSHTVSIYRKLGVGSRSDAVRVAKELDLL